METKTANMKPDEAQNRIDSCSANSTFNFVVGTIAIVTAAIAGFIIYSQLFE
ncbi:hypothetical protein LVD17_15710 [Fulvivirga ulvae]|uniref:hypothetical protein n=1 Tax=Fulvivirga ulvae TaxID=2904245 RepID=UPI001F272961|nr:hypothetical protein [Fulvivirga ulvae]UII29746.1 hypothetical protein LVD17_15710 [Fulvivirga ulvae]